MLKCYHKLSIVTTLVTFGTSGLWGSLLSGSKKRFIKLAQLRFFTKLKIATHNKTFFSKRGKICHCSSFTLLTCRWPLHVYLVLFVVGHKLCNFLPELYTQPFNHPLFSQWHRSQKQGISISSSLGSYPQTLGRTPAFTRLQHGGISRFFRNIFFKLKRSHYYLRSCGKWYVELTNWRQFFTHLSCH